MNFVLKPWQLVLIVIAGWMNREQQEVIKYLRTENAVLREKLGKRRILLSDDQRRRMAVKGKILSYKRLSEVGTLFTPDTILRWHRQLIANEWDHSNKRSETPGRPRVRQVIVDLTLQFAEEKPTWGYDRIQGALATPGRCALTQLNAAFAERISETDLRFDRKSEIRCALFPKICPTRYPVEFFDPTTSPMKRIKPDHATANWTRQPAKSELIP